MIIKVYKIIICAKICRGAMEDCWAHNPDAGVSKPLAAISFLL